jgi:hypothetical protein
MSALTIKVDISGAGEVDAVLQAMRNGLARRGPMHSRMAVRAMEATQGHLRSDQSHNTAARLGATPTGFRNKAAASVTAQHDEDEGRVVIPRRTGLGRAFGDVVIRPGSGRTYLTIPAHSKTYGKSVRDNFPEGTFRFAPMGRYRALLWADGPYKGEVAYWLKREVSQKQDRTLLPSDAVYIKVARDAAIKYLNNLASGGPRGGISTGFPSAFPS